MVLWYSAGRRGISNRDPIETLDGLMVCRTLKCRYGPFEVQVNRFPLAPCGFRGEKMIMIGPKTF